MLAFVDMDSIVRTVDAVHPPAIVCARAERPTVIYDGLGGMLLVEDAGGWHWHADGTTRPLHDLVELEHRLGTMAERYEREPSPLRAQAAQSVDALRLRWIRDALAAPSPRPWGLCAPGHPRHADTLPRMVLYDVARPVTREQIAAEVERLHPAALVGSDGSWPVLVLDGVSWLLLLELEEAWHWAIDEEHHGRVHDYLALQVLLSAMAAAYAVLDEGQRRRAQAQARELSQQGLPERLVWAHRRARSRGRTGRR